MNQEYRFLARGIWHPYQIIIRHDDTEKVYPAEVVELINSTWDAAIQRPGIRLFNAAVPAMVDWHEEDDRLVVNTMRTDYRCLFGTNIHNAVNVPYPNRANALAVCAVVETSDGGVVIGQRSTDLAEGTGLWHVPGGTLCIDESDSVSPAIWSGKMHDYQLPGVNPIAQMLRELREELGIEIGDVRDALCLALAENTRSGKPEFITCFHIHLTAGELLQRATDAADAHEHTQLEIVPRDAIPAFLSSHRVVPIGQAALLAYLEHVNPANTLSNNDRMEA